MKIDGYIITYSRYGQDTTYQPATIVEVGKATFKVIDDRGHKRTFNLAQDWRNSNGRQLAWLPPAKGQNLEERGKRGYYHSAPCFDMDVEKREAEAKAGIAAQALRARYTKALAALDAFTLKHRDTHGRNADEAYVARLEAMAALVPAPAAVALHEERQAVPA